MKNQIQIASSWWDKNVCEKQFKNLTCEECPCHGCAWCMKTDDELTMEDFKAANMLRPLYGKEK